MEDIKFELDAAMLNAAVEWASKKACTAARYVSIGVEILQLKEIDGTITLVAVPTFKYEPPEE